MSWNTNYTGSQIDEALDKGRNLKIVNNGWIRLESSTSAPTNLGNLKNPGNYITSFWIDGPDFGNQDITPINISNVMLDGILHQYVTGGTMSYVRKIESGKSVYGNWIVDQSDSAIITSPTAPTLLIDGKTIWLDTSNASAPVLKIYIFGEWKVVIPEGSMLSSIYDPQGKKTDIFNYIDSAVSAMSNTSIESIDDHVSNNSIHVNAEEKSKIINSASQADVEAASETLETDIEIKVDTKIAEKISAIDDVNEAATNVSNEVKSHTEDTSIHPSATKQASWDSKAADNHTHNLDGRVTIKSENIQGVISSDKLPYDVKERVYTVRNESELYSLKKNPVHNGDTVCVENETGNEWYFVVDENYLGMAGVDTWKNVQLSTTSRTWISGCYGNGKYVIISYDSSKFAYSNDGITWTEGNIGSTSRSWMSICYGNGKFVAIARDSDKFAYSNDGVTWTEGNINSRSWSCVCYGDGKYVAVSRNSNIFAYSNNGITWTEGNIPSRSWFSVCYGNGKFVAVAYESNKCAYSYDGVTWAESTISSTARNWASVCYGNGKYVAIASGEVYSTVAHSNDGINWVELYTSNEYREWLSVCYGNGKYVAIDYTGSTYIESTDGINWIEGPLDTVYREWMFNFYGNGNFVALAADSVARSGSLLPNSAKAFKKFATSTLDWVNVQNTPTTLSGYGITDAVTKEEYAVVETEVAQISSSIPSQIDLTNTAEAHTAYTAAVNNLNELDSAIIAMDNLISKIEAIAE